MKKVLIVANLRSVFARELANEFWEKQLDVTLMDFETLQIVTSTKENEMMAKRFERFRQWPKIHMFFRLYFMRQFILASDFTHINLHYSRWVYVLIRNVFKARKLFISFYGSDVYRSSWVSKQIQRPLYLLAEGLSFTNSKTQEHFLRYHRICTNKTRVCRFGLKTLDYIDQNRNTAVTIMRETLGYKVDKYIITCGYNATPGQQHMKMISQLEGLGSDIKTKVQFVFPMTYGNMDYKSKVMERLKETDLDYVVLENFLHGDENAYVKLASNMMINLLVTDSFSGSMQEFLYAKNEVITGEWLPYDVFDEAGIVYSKLNGFEALPHLIEQVMTLNRNDLLEKNIGIIDQLSNWKNCIYSWEEMYESH